MPFLAEEIYQKTKSNSSLESVHLENWTSSLSNFKDLELIEEMAKVRSLVTIALELRQKAGIKVRQPLQSLKIKNSPFAKALMDGQNAKLNNQLIDLIKDEINVKEVLFDNSIATDVWLNTELTEELKAEGLARDIMRGIQDARKKENLNPSDKVSLTIYASEQIKKIFEDYTDMIKSPTGVTEINFSDEKQEYSIILETGEISIKIYK